MTKNHHAIELLKAERDTIKPRLKLLRDEIKDHERAINKHAWRVRDFANYQEQVDALIDLSCEKYRQLLELEVRARTIGGEIFKLANPADDIDRRTRSYRAQRPPYKRRGKYVLTPATD